MTDSNCQVIMLPSGNVRVRIEICPDPEQLKEMTRRMMMRIRILGHQVEEFVYYGANGKDSMFRCIAKGDQYLLIYSGNEK